MYTNQSYIFMPQLWSYMVPRYVLEGVCATYRHNWDSNCISLYCRHGCQNNSKCKMNCDNTFGHNRETFCQRVLYKFRLGQLQPVRLLLALLMDGYKNGDIHHDDLDQGWQLKTDKIWIFYWNFDFLLKFRFSIKISIFY